jgi:hydroxymethylglutaryl-CoA reductase (NADPH)
MAISASTMFAQIPQKWIGPLLLVSENTTEEVQVPLATYETTLWPSTARGARVSCRAGGISCTILSDQMTRSILLEVPDAGYGKRVEAELQTSLPELQTVVNTTSRFATLISVHGEHLGNLLFLRFAFTTGDAAGHNMTTKAADAIRGHILKRFPELKDVSVSGNFCTDKKVSAVNGILGRGKKVIAEAVIEERWVKKYLKSSAGNIAELNVRKNLLGSIAAGSLRSGNAHVANLLLGFYLATGQDAANIVEGSQAVTHAEDRDGDLYFSVTLPHLILGTVGNGKGLSHVEDTLTRLGCKEERGPGENARRLAQLCAATVWCGELSLMAALTNPGELMASHEKYERA